MTRVLVDANVFLYALGTAHRYRDSCRTIIGDLATRRIHGEVSVEILQEVVHVRRTRGPGAADAVARAREIAAWNLPIHAVDDVAWKLALDLLDANPELSTRDAVHAATALAQGIEIILSADRDFERIEGLTRIDPLDETAVARLRDPSR